MTQKKWKNFKEIHIPTDFPAFFVDSTLENEVDNIKTKKEVQKLIEWARNKEYIDLSYIKDNNIDANSKNLMILFHLKKKNK